MYVRFGGIRNTKTWNKSNDTVADRPIPRVSYGSFEKFKTSASEVLSMIHPRSFLLFRPITVPLYMCPCLRSYISVTFHRKIFHMVTKGLVRALYKVVTRSRFSSTYSFNSCRRWVEVKWGWLSVTNICTVILLLHTMSHQWLLTMCVIRYGYTKSRKIWGVLEGGSITE